MKILVIGSGGREHALVWKLKTSPQFPKIYCAPGNGGIAQDAELVQIKADDLKGLLDFALKEKIGLTIVGPEAPLAEGIVNKFMQKGLNIFGPTKELALLEASKAYSKETMQRLNIPTAAFEIFDTPDKAIDFTNRSLLFAAHYPLVVKADGLAAGKGVIICKDRRQAQLAIEHMMVRKAFGKSGEKIIIEECLAGEEASILVVSDGINVIPLASSQDHKRVFDGDKGPNTGGMGAYSPAPAVSEEMHKRIMNEIIYPLINGLAKENKFYKGVLYAGIMITKNGPKVLEFNVRFGDPETQAILPRLKTDLADLCLASIEDKIDQIKLKWEEKTSLCVVLASGGYPGEYKNGLEISGLEEALWEGSPDTYIFHAGTKLQSANGKSQIVTDGGRVLNVVSLGDNIRQAIDKVYKAAHKIKFAGLHYRKDIGHRALERYLEDTYMGAQAD
ncbi:MAG: phosphoribosylamine--glycine ligase [Omnitrophica WOR_2 bacterium RIFCSPHIGHO2_02_FULL_45_21]|nr:MAG: phosphoribosylamine--glycine ligase [Omnitrophica WOR_2 bacterium RIFCSPHIGHO2_02_FULL_45_21]